MQPTLFTPQHVGAPVEKFFFFLKRLLSLLVFFFLLKKKFLGGKQINIAMVTVKEKGSNRIKEKKIKEYAGRMHRFFKKIHITSLVK